MQVKSKALFLGSIKHQDNGQIFRFFTEQNGFLSFYVRNSKKNKFDYIKGALLGLFIIDYNYKENSKIFTFTSLESNSGFIEVLHPIRLSLLFFYAEVVKQTTLEGEQDVEKFQFLLQESKSVRTLDMELLKYLPILFLLNYANILGVYPDKLISPIFKSGVPENTINQSVIEKLKGLNKNERDEILNELILHFKMHLDGFKELKTLQVLREMYL